MSLSSLIPISSFNKQELVFGVKNETLIVRLRGRKSCLRFCLLVAGNSFSNIYHYRPTLQRVRSLDEKRTCA